MQTACNSMYIWSSGALCTKVKRESKRFWIQLCCFPINVKIILPIIPGTTASGHILQYECMLNWLFWPTVFCALNNPSHQQPFYFYLTFKNEKYVIWKQPLIIHKFIHKTSTNNRTCICSVAQQAQCISSCCYLLCLLRHIIWYTLVILLISSLQFLWSSPKL